MDKPWYRKMFCAAPNPNGESAQSRADDGNAEAQFRLGLKYAAVAGGEPDYGEAAQWYRKAADQNHPLAQFNLGILYAQGQGVPQDKAAALGWLLQAAQQGHAGAQFNLGMSLQRASFDEPPEQARESKIEAYKWYCLAAAQDHQESATAGGRLTMTMTHETVAEGNHRAAAFVAVKPRSPQAN